MSDEGRLDHKLDRIVSRHREISSILAEGKSGQADFARMSKEFAELDPLVSEVQALRRAEVDVAREHHRVVAAGGMGQDQPGLAPGVGDAGRGQRRDRRAERGLGARRHCSSASRSASSSATSASTISSSASPSITLSIL